MFKAAAGCLHWTPEVIWEAPISQVILAVEGCYDFAINTNPFGGGKKKTEKETASDRAKREMLERNKAKALKFDMMVFNARQKSLGKKNG